MPRELTNPVWIGVFLYALARAHVRVWLGR
jgi:hypothetical protein